jgi:hypothetical protein
MAIQRVKRKVPYTLVPIAVALLTFGVSYAGVLPELWVEDWYSRRVFPSISHSLGLVADVVSFSWVDLGVPAAVLLFAYCLARKRWAAAGALIALAYLWFFWTWGINYHRRPLASRLQLNTRVTSAASNQFVETAIRELNRLSPLVEKTVQKGRPSTTAIETQAADRIQKVMLRIEGRDWRAPRRVKRSLLIDQWFRVSGVDGAFNPFGHEPLVAANLLPVELPFVAAHELAHVRGIPNEGEANLVALLATVASDDPLLQYSGWLHVWFYLSNPKRDARLDPGPRADIQKIYKRNLSHQIPIARNLQTTVLDFHLKANDVREGVRSYAGFITMAIASRDTWGKYR